MRIKLPFAALSLTAAIALAALTPATLAETAPPSAAEKPAAPAKRRAAPGEQAAAKNVSIAEKAQKCLQIKDDDRLQCYDEALKPQPNPNPTPVKGIRDCRHVVDGAERLNCFDGFAVQIPKFTH
jgi:hypothetical protein